MNTNIATSESAPQSFLKPMPSSTIAITWPTIPAIWGARGRPSERLSDQAVTQFMQRQADQQRADQQQTKGGAASVSRRDEVQRKKTHCQREGDMHTHVDSEDARDAKRPPHGATIVPRETLGEHR